VRSGPLQPAPGLAAMSVSSARPAWQLPIQWPDPAIRPAAGGSIRAEYLLKSAIIFAMLALTVLDRFGLRVTGGGSVPIGLMAMYGLAFAMVLSGAARLNPQGALAYLVVITTAGLSLMINAASAPSPFVSKMSFLFLLALYAPFAVSLHREAVSPRLWRWTMDLYVFFALLIALAGIVQYFVQFVFHPSWLFDYTPLIPERLRATSGFNTAYMVQDAGGNWVKSNGFFMREPSIFSVVMAFGLLSELYLARRKWVMATFAMALVLSYSGSGLLALITGMVFPLGRRTVTRILGLTAFAVALFLFLGDALNLSYTLNRLDEFSVRNSSAYCRFIYPTVATFQQIDSSPWTTLVGHGPGSMERMGADCPLGGQTTYAKALFEYGLVGVLAFGFLVVGALNRSAAPIRIRVAAGAAWLLLGGNLLDGLYLLFIYILSAMWPEGFLRRVSPESAASQPERSQL
jgi:hypothetical protein